MNKIFFIIGFFLFMPSVLAATLWTADNILNPGFKDLFSTLTLGYGNYKYEDVVPGMFGYTLKAWEIDVCSRYVTGDLSYKMPDSFKGVSTDLSKIYDTSATLQALKTVYSVNQTLIEVAWYIHPKMEIKYNVALIKGSQKEYILKGEEADPLQGDTGYFADYLDINYEKVVLEYDNGVEILKTDIIEK
ncbi:MAG: hypothetical protein QXK76_02795 [Candidatus Woesearchaeota archaeon]